MSNFLYVCFRGGLRLLALQAAVFTAPIYAGPSPMAPTTQQANLLPPQERDELNALYVKAAAANSEWNKLASDESVLRDPSTHAQLLAALFPLYQDYLRFQNEAISVRALEFPKIDMPDPVVALTETSARAVPMQGILIAVGDRQAIAQADAEAACANVSLANIGKLKLGLAEWLDAPDDAARQHALDKIASVLKGADVNDPAVTPAVERTLHDFQPADGNPTTTDSRQRLQDVVLASFPSETCKKDVAAWAERRQDHLILSSVGDKPLVLTGTTVDGKTFSTADWKGKVVLVDFWATWCGPCKKELPRVKAVYQKYHEQGLEVLGVCNDRDPEALTKYLANDPALAWPNLFDPEAAKARQWHPLSKKYGVDAIPRIFLIDRNGICRTVEGRENMDDMIPKLLAETPKVVAAN